MKPLLFLTLASMISALAFAACSGTTAGPVVPPGPPKTMKAFKSEQELTQYLQKLAEEQKKRLETRAVNTQTAELSDVAGVAANGLMAKSAEPAESVTNTQHEGVDEGDIVKVYGDQLVILRRG